MDEKNKIEIISNEFYLAESRAFSDEEKSMIWIKPQSHKISEDEIRICKEIKRNWDRGEMKIANILLEGDAGSGKTQLAKALSSDFGLPYVKVTCFSDMDKSDILGAILPVISDEKVKKLSEDDAEALKALYEADAFRSSTDILKESLNISYDEARIRMKRIMNLVKGIPDEDVIEYKFYASEIVRAYRNGYLLEIQEPTVIRDAAVLMALNSALELDGSINLPTEIIQRHPDFIAVVTTNRNYVGCKPLNESLRDRIQHTEKMDLPGRDVMIERARLKTGYNDLKVLGILSDAIIVLDKTARVNAIKGVAGMRSLFYWADAIAHGYLPKESLYHKVIYKITTDSEEIKILEDSLAQHGIIKDLDELEKANEKEETTTGLKKNFVMTHPK